MLKNLSFLLLFLLPAFLSASVFCPESVARRIQAHLLIGDPKSAVEEAYKALQKHPQDPLILEWLIRSLADSGEDALMMKNWEQFHALYEERAMKNALLEEMCWGILRKGKNAFGISTQLICIIGAALTQDIRATAFLLDGMRHTNAHIRTLSVELSTLYGDYPLREEICRLVQEEEVFEVRLKAIKALGKLEIESYLPYLIQCVANPKKGAREKLAAIEAIVQMRDSIGKEELQVLAASKRAGLRQLACEAIAVCELRDEVDLLQPLIQDSHPEVSAAALKAWGLLRKEVTVEIKCLAREALDPTVGVTASWVWLINEPLEGEKAMLKWLKHEQSSVRALAASAIAAAGPYGTSLAKKMLKQTQDPYVVINLALALAGQREECDEICKLLEQILLDCRDKWMISENGLFKTFEKNTLSHNPTIPNFPEVVNQIARLEILNLLAILEYPSALDAIKTFLKERKWGVTGLAAELLLGEGDEKAIELVRELLQDPDPEIRLEAALVLASWGKDSTATETLLEVYPTADRQLQLKILESLGRIGDKSTIPFLLQRLKEPALTIRIVAASILIQILNH